MALWPLLEQNKYECACQGHGHGANFDTSRLNPDPNLNKQGKLYALLKNCYGFAALLPECSVAAFVDPDFEFFMFTYR